MKKILMYLMIGLFLPVFTGYAVNYSRYDCVRQIDCPRCTAYVIGYDTYGQRDPKMVRLLAKEFEDLVEDPRNRAIGNQLGIDHANGFTDHQNGRGQLYNRPHTPLMNIQAANLKKAKYTRDDCVEQINCPLCTAYVIGYDVVDKHEDKKLCNKLYKKLTKLHKDYPSPDMDKEIDTAFTNGKEAAADGHGELWKRPHPPLLNLKKNTLMSHNHAAGLSPATFDAREADAYNQAYKTYARLAAAGYDNARITENMNEVMNFLQSDYRAAGPVDEQGLAEAYHYGWYDASNGGPNKTLEK